MEKDEFDQITDKHIPQRPMGAVEGASYTLVIVGGKCLSCVMFVCCVPCKAFALSAGACALDDADSVLPYCVQGLAEVKHQNQVAVNAGLAVAGAVLWAAANELLIQPKEYTCFNLALERIRCSFRSGSPAQAGRSS